MNINQLETNKKVNGVRTPGALNCAEGDGEVPGGAGGGGGEAKGGGSTACLLADTAIAQKSNTTMHFIMIAVKSMLIMEWEIREKSWDICNLQLNQGQADRFDPVHLGQAIVQGFRSWHSPIVIPNSTLTENV